jgi:hypothetical protein
VRVSELNLRIYRGWVKRKGWSEWKKSNARWHHIREMLYKDRVMASIMCQAPDRRMLMEHVNCWKDMQVTKLTTHTRYKEHALNLDRATAPTDRVA